MPDPMLARLWSGIGGATEGRVELTGPDQVLPSVFDVTGLAAAAVAVASLAVAEFSATRDGGPPPEVTIDRRAASAAFLSEALFAPQGWERAPAWDPIAGDYRCADGWIRLHTNYSYHRAAVELVLGEVPTRAEVAQAVARWAGERLQDAVVAAGGCAAVLHDAQTWRRSEPGRAALSQAVCALRPRRASRRFRPSCQTCPPASGAPSWTFTGPPIGPCSRVSSPTPTCSSAACAAMLSTGSATARAPCGPSTRS